MLKTTNKMAPCRQNRSQAGRAMKFSSTSNCTAGPALMTVSPRPSLTGGDIVDMTPFCVWFNRLHMPRKATITLWRIFLHFSTALGSRGTTKGTRNYRRSCWWRFCGDLTIFMEYIEFRVKCVTSVLLVVQ